MEAGTYLQEATHATTQLYSARSRFGDAAEHFQEGGFAGAVAPNDANDFARLNLQRYILERPEIPVADRLRDCPAGGPDETAPAGCCGMGDAFAQCLVLAAGRRTKVVEFREI